MSNNENKSFRDLAEEYALQEFCVNKAEEDNRNTQLHLNKMLLELNNRYRELSDFVDENKRDFAGVQLNDGRFLVVAEATNTFKQRIVKIFDSILGMSI